MAQIRNSINLTDNMSGKLNTINKSLNRLIKQMNRATVTTNKMTKALNQCSASAKKASGNMSKAASSAGKLASSMGRMKSGGFNLPNLASGLYILERAFSITKSMMEAADEGTTAVARIGLYNESDATNEEIYRGVYETAQESRTDIGATADLYNRMLVSGAMEGPGKMQRLLDITGTINKAAIAGGGTKNEISQALRQLSQGISSGTLQGDELRSIREQAPFLADALAEGLGKVDEKFKGIGIGELKELGAQGELTAERVLKAFEAMEDEINEKFMKMPRTFEQNMTVINNSLKYWLYLLKQDGQALDILNDKATELANWFMSDEGEKAMERLGQALNVVASIISAVADGIGKLADNADKVDNLISIFTLLGAVAGIVLTVLAIKMAIVAWPITLTIIGVVALAGAFRQMGATASDIISGVVKLFAWVYVTVVNVIIWLYNFIGPIFYDLGVMMEDPILGFGYLCVDVLFGVLEAVATVADAFRGLFELLGAEPGTSFVEDVREDREKAKAKIREALGTSQSKDPFETKEYKDYEDVYKKADEMVASFNATIEDSKNYAGSGATSFSTTVDGGDLDSVGKIKDDVDISDEDIKLLKDIAAREFLLNLTTQTPTVNVKFGDVRETADVKKIMETIEDMLEEAAATSLVYG